MSARRGAKPFVGRAECVMFARGLMRGKIRARVVPGRPAILPGAAPFPLRQIVRDGHVVAQGETWTQCYSNLRANVPGVES